VVRGHPQRRPGHPARKIDEHVAVGKAQPRGQRVEVGKSGEADMGEVGGKIRAHGVFEPDLPQRRRPGHHRVHRVVAFGDERLGRVAGRVVHAPTIITA
jgi:hypothetical protein